MSRHLLIRHQRRDLHRLVHQVIEFRRGADELGGWLNDSDVPIRQGWGVAGVTVLPSP